MKLSISAFADGMAIPSKYTCDGPDVSPALAWSDAPVDVRSFGIIVDDPDAPGGDWVHWVIYGLPAQSHGLPEGVAASEKLLDGARQGLNDFGRVGYGGPCPPRGGPHRYCFKLYALDAELSLPPRAKKSELMRAMQGHVLAEARWIGTYQRR